MVIQKTDYEHLLHFRSSIRKYLRFAEEGARAEGLTPQQHQLLLAVKGQPGREWATLSEIALALQLKHHATVGLADRCQANGLISRTHSLQDRRKVQVTLTEKGEQILEKLSLRNLQELRLLSKAFNLE